MEKSDTQLVSDFRNGEEKALEELVDRYLSPLYLFVVRLTGNTDEAQDIVQETFLKMWKKLHTFSPEKSFKTWLFTIARNSAIDYLRKKRAVNFSQLDNEAFDMHFEDTLEEPSPLPDELFAGTELRQKLESALEQLPLAHKTVVLLHLDQEMTFREIADVTGDSLNTVKSRYRRALVKIQEHLLADAPKTPGKT